MLNRFADDKKQCHDSCHQSISAKNYLNIFFKKFDFENLGYFTILTLFKTLFHQIIH